MKNKLQNSYELNHRGTGKENEKKLFEKCQVQILSQSPADTDYSNIIYSSKQWHCNAIKRL